MTDFNFLTNYLRMWKAEGIEAPKNELQSLSAWLAYLGQHGAEKTKETMRTRMFLLTKTVDVLSEQGSKAEVVAGIYDNDLESLRKRTFNEGVEEAAKLVDKRYEAGREVDGEQVRSLKVDFG